MRSSDSIWWSACAATSWRVDENCAPASGAGLMRCEGCGGSTGRGRGVSAARISGGSPGPFILIGSDMVFPLLGVDGAPRFVSTKRWGPLSASGRMLYSAARAADPGEDLAHAQRAARRRVQRRRRVAGAVAQPAEQVEER